MNLDEQIENAEKKVLFLKMKKLMEDERSKTPIEFYFPPPWRMDENPEKTEGWIEFQKALTKDPKYYLSHFLKDFNDLP